MVALNPGSGMYVCDAEAICLYLCLSRSQLLGSP